MNARTYSLRRRAPLALVAWAALALTVWPGQAAEPPAPDDRVIELPPLEVTATVANARPWSYVRFPGGEVLARTSPQVTREFLAAHFRLQQLVALFLPAELQPRNSVPEILILTTPGAGGSLPAEILAQAREPATAPDAEGYARPGGVRTIENLRLGDVDASVVYALVDEFAFSGNRVHFTLSQIRFLLERRVPRLPDWFIVGTLDVFDQMKFADDTLEIGKAGWAPKEEAVRVAGDADYPPPLLAMDDLLVQPAPPARGETLAASQTWRAQAALFVRWMLENDARRPRLWKLAARAAEEPMTDELCREVIGLDFVDLRDRLSDYLRPAMRRGEFRLRAKLEERPPVELRPATPAEIARLKGDWERMAANWVRARYPQFAARYVFQARRTLAQAYERGERDPQLLAVLGLFECDQGDDKAARPLLETAVAAKVVRPRVYFELARLRYADALAQLSPERKLLHSTQVNAVLEPFKLAGLQEPPLLEAHRLVTEVWSRSTATLGPEQFAWCDRALKDFPKDAGLLYNIALIYVVHGRISDAAALAQRGLALSETAAAKARFTKLGALLSATNREPANSADLPR